MSIRQDSQNVNTALDIERTFQTLVTPGDVIEVRAILAEAGKAPGVWDGWTRDIVSGYFDTSDAFTECVVALEGTGRTVGTYLTLNPCDEALLARAANRLKAAGKDPTTSDDNITRRRWLLIDADANRPSGISATDEEKQAALQAIDEAVFFLDHCGWPEPVLADSGNGGHALYRIDLPNDDKVDELIRLCLMALAMRFDNDAVSIDTSVHNAGRISKIYGTMVRKGDNVQPRPHRVSQLIHVPDTIEVVDKALLTALKKTLPDDADKPSTYQNGHVFDVPAFIKRHNLEVSKEGEWKNGYRWELQQCPMNADHNDRKAFIVQFPSGAVGAGCLHANTCKPWKWQDLRRKLDGERSDGQTRDDTEGPPELEPAIEYEPEPSTPVLPEELSPRPASSDWLECYVDYAEAIAPLTPQAFHESAALWLVATAIARRLVLKMPFGDIYPNIFVCWVARSSIFNKSTSLDIARGVARDTFPHLLASEETTPEALFSDMGGIEPAHIERLSEDEYDLWKRERNHAAQRSWSLDEMSGLLASAGRDYNAGLLEFIIKLYDCDPRRQRSTRGQGRVVIKNAYLSLLGASTPAAMAQHLNAEQLWGNGWWPRFAVLTSDAEVPDWEEAREVNRPVVIKAILQNIYERLPIPSWPEQPVATTVGMADGVHALWKKYAKLMRYDLLVGGDLETRIEPSYARLPVHVLKVSTLLAALDWPEGQRVPIISMGHLGKAIEIVEYWRKSLHRAIALASTTTLNNLERRVVKLLSKAGRAGMTMRDLCNAMRDVDRSTLRGVVEGLVNDNEVEEFKTTPGKKGGRPSVRFRIP